MIPPVGSKLLSGARSNPVCAAGFMLPYALIMLFIYPVGVPLFYGLTLFRNRHELRALRHLELSAVNEGQRIELGKFLKGRSLREYQPEIDEATERKALLEEQYSEKRKALPGNLRKLTAGYEMRTYGFEIFECLRKILLIGLPIFLPADSPEQLCIGLIICFATFGSYMMFAPYVNSGDDMLSQICQFQIFFSLLSKIILQTNANNPVMGILLPVMLALPPVTGFIFQSGVLGEIGKINAVTKDGFETPCGTFGVGWREKLIAILEKILGVKQLPIEGEDEEEEGAAVHPSASFGPYPTNVTDCFSKFDQDKDGFLDYRELRDALRTFGIDVTLPRAAAIIKRYDDQPDRKMEMSEFAELILDLERGYMRAHEVEGSPPNAPLNASRTLPPPSTSMQLSSMEA